MLHRFLTVVMVLPAQQRLEVVEVHFLRFVMVGDLPCFFLSRKC